MDLILLKIWKQLQEYPLLVFGIFMIIIIMPARIRELNRKKLLENLNSEERFFLKQLFYLNDDIFLYTNPNNELLTSMVISLEKKGVIFKSQMSWRDKSGYEIRTWVKNEIEYNPKILI